MHTRVDGRYWQCQLRPPLHVRLGASQSDAWETVKRWRCNYPRLQLRDLQEKPTWLVPQVVTPRHLGRNFRPLWLIDQRFVWLEDLRAYGWWHQIGQASATWHCWKIEDSLRCTQVLPSLRQASPYWVCKTNDEVCRHYHSKRQKWSNLRKE